MSSTLILLIIGLSLGCVVNGTFSPNVTVQSCYSRKLRVELRGGADEGLIFIQGRGPECSQTTEQGTRVYEFDFTTCNLLYDKMFRLVVQEKTHVQRGSDTVTPIMCLVDTRELTVTGVIFPEETMTDSVNKTVKPIVRMSMLSEDTAENNELIREVTLDDRVKLSVKLDEEFIGGFDIKPKDCMASLLPLVRDGCSTDGVLFPNFEKRSMGDLVTTFHAFQPTNLQGDADVDVTFTCNIAVCKGLCHTSICDGFRRMTRDADDPDDITERVNVHATLKVKSRPGESMKVSQTAVCTERVLFTTVSTVGIGTLIASWILACCALSKLRNVDKKSPTKPCTLRRLSEKNVNFAKSVGRRLSTMFNIPVGYDMRGSKLADWLPDQCDDSRQTKRRESVTVSMSDEVVTSRRESHVSNLECLVRKRCIDACVQTEERNCKRVLYGLRSSESSPNMTSFNNPILSISIRSNSLTKYDFSKHIDELADDRRSSEHGDLIVENMCRESSTSSENDIKPNKEGERFSDIMNGTAEQPAYSSSYKNSKPSIHDAKSPKGPFKTVIDTRMRMTGLPVPVNKENSCRRVAIGDENLAGVEESSNLGNADQTLIFAKGGNLLRRDSTHV